MEVHHHPDLHHNPKKWKEYFLEFLMIFLAVTLGFFAEGLREKLADKEKARQGIESLVKCLESDQSQLKSIISANKKVIRHLDSLVLLRHADLTDKKSKKSFLINSVVGFSEDWYFSSNDAALLQLKSSGTLRLIRDHKITDSIFKYELNNKTITGQQADLYGLFRDAFNDYKKAVGLFFYRDKNVMKYSLGYDNSDVEFKNIDEVTISSDKEKVNILFGDAATMAAPQEAYIHLMQNQLAYGKVLIDMLKKEYNIE